MNIKIFWNQKNLRRCSTRPGLQIGEGRACPPCSVLKISRHLPFLPLSGRFQRLSRHGHIFICPTKKTGKKPPYCQLYTCITDILHTYGAVVPHWKGCKTMKASNLMENSVFNESKNAPRKRLIYIHLHLHLYGCFLH